MTVGGMGFIPERLLMMMMMILKYGSWPVALVAYIVLYCCCTYCCCFKVFWGFPCII